jgi:hypothetical protein
MHVLTAAHGVVDAIRAIARETQAVVRVHALPAARNAFGAVPRDHRPLQQKSSPHARDVIVPVPIRRRRSRKSGHDGDEAARWYRPVESAAAPEPPSEPDERLVVARQAPEPRHILWYRVLASGEEPELAVGLADGERPQPHGERDVEARRRAAGGEGQVLVDDVDGAVPGEDGDHPVRLEHGVAQERAAGVAHELEGRRPARRPAGLLQPERVGDVQAPACLGRRAACWLLGRFWCSGRTSN